MTKIQQLQDDIAYWSDSTFGCNRSPMGCLNHLVFEVQELIDAPTDRMEYADCFMLLLDAYRMAGYNADDLIDAGIEKLEICRLREWEPVNENGVSMHVKKN
jgi:hypothetical protein